MTPKPATGFPFTGSRIAVLRGGPLDGQEHDTSCLWDSHVAFTDYSVGGGVKAVYHWVIDSPPYAFFEYDPRKNMMSDAEILISL